MQYLSRASQTSLLAAALLSILNPVGRLSAQADGIPIRLQTTAKPGKWITGRAAGVTSDSVTIVPNNTPDTLRFAKGELHRLEASQGRKSNAGKGALIGGAVGGGVMLALGIACAADTSEGDIVGCGGREVAVVTLAGAASGAALGALIGTMSHREKWEAVELGPNVSVGLHGRRGVGLTIKF
jgi:hypothetical protein